MTLSAAILHPPVFEDEDKTRAAALLHFILTTSTVLNGIAILSTVLLTLRSDITDLNTLIVALVAQISMLILLYRGNVRVTSVIFCTAAWLVVAYNTYHEMGILNPGFAAQVIVVISAGLLINGSAALVAAGFSTIYGIWLVEAAEAGRYVAQFGPMTAREAGINYAAGFIMTALLLFVGLRAIREARERAARIANALRKSEERYRSLVEKAPEFIFTIDQKRQAGFMNRIPEGAPENITGRSIYDFVAPQDQDLYRTTIDRVFEEGTTERIELESKNSTGQLSWFSVRLAPIWEDGRVVEITAISTNISEHKQMEEALRGSQEQYKELFESNPQPMFVIDTDTLNFLAVNDAAVSHYGYSREEFLKMTSRDIRMPDDLPQLEDQIGRFRQQQPLYTRGGPLRHLKKDGSIIRVEAAAHRMSYDGHHAALIASNDLTERLRAEEALQRSEELFSKVFQSVPVAIGISTIKERQLLDVNNHFLKMTGYDRGEVLHRTAREVGLWGSEAEQYDSIIGKAMAENNAIRALEGQWKTRNGENLDVLFSAQPIEVGGEPCILSIAVDITERKQAENALRRSEELFSKIFQAVPAAITISHISDGRILNINPYALELTGYRADEMIDRSADDIDLWSPVSQRDRLVQELHEKGALNNKEGQWKTKSGDSVDMLISMEQIEIRGEDCILEIGVNITERKRLDRERLEAEKLRLAVEKEREFVALKDGFLTQMSHEFRTPLAIILGAKESLEHYYERMKPERRQEHFQNINEQVFYVTSMLDEVLTLSKARSGKLFSNPAQMDLAGFCQKLFEQVQLTDTQHHKFVWDYDGQIGEVEMDQTLLQHILVNLLSNAIKYSPEGGEVRLELSRIQDEVLIQVTDQGVGISEENQKHLFEPFYRASKTQFIKGTGLGLAIVKESVEAHGGMITCKSLEGKGTTFTVRLPLAVKV